MNKEVEELLFKTTLDDLDKGSWQVSHHIAENQLGWHTEKLTIPPFDHATKRASDMWSVQEKYVTVCRYSGNMVRIWIQFPTILSAIALHLFDFSMIGVDVNFDTMKVSVTFWNDSQSGG